MSVSIMTHPLDPSMVDRQWWGFNGWKMLPMFLITGVLSVGLFIVDLNYDHSWFSGLVIVISLIQLIRMSYCSITFSYRLTSKRLLVDYGNLYSPQAAITPSDIRDVHVIAHKLDRLCGVGTVRLRLISGRTIDLIGVTWPDSVAVELNRWKTSGS